MRLVCSRSWYSIVFIESSIFPSLVTSERISLEFDIIFSLFKCESYNLKVVSYLIIVSILSIKSFTAGLFSFISSMVKPSSS